METVIIAIHLMVVVALVIVVLLQRSEGGALGIGGGGGGGFMTGRGQANVLTRATAILATIFFITSLTLTIMANMGRAQKSIFDTTGNKPAPSAPAQPGQAPASGQKPAGGGLFEQLQKMEQGQPAPTTPPAAPPAGTPRPGQ